MLLNDVLMIAGASAGGAAVQWWVSRGIHRRALNALKKCHGLAQQEAAELLAHCRRQNIQLKGELAVSAQNAHQNCEAASRVPASRAVQQADELPTVRSRRTTDDRADTLHYAQGRFNHHGYARTAVMEGHYGHCLAQPVAKDLWDCRA